jgi:LPPG:FO 2-phospho-L-lactate transferase
VAVSPIVGGKALKGPADRMLTNLGMEATAVGVASLYHQLLPGWLTGFVLDTVDADTAPRIQALGPRTLVTDTVMRTVADRGRLAREVLSFAEELARAAG